MISDISFSYLGSSTVAIAYSFCVSMSANRLLTASSIMVFDVFTPWSDSTVIEAIRVQQHRLQAPISVLTDFGTCTMYCFIEWTHPGRVF